METTNGKDFDFSQEDMMSIRYKIQDDLSAGKLKNHNGIEGEDFARSNKESKRNDSNKSFENTLGRRMPKDDLEAKDPLQDVLFKSNRKVICKVLRINQNLLST